jgi:ATP-dependent Lon protease
MTGEVTLRGRVLPIGGVRQKVLAAYRSGLTEVVLPARNGPDLEDVPDEVRELMTFHLAERVEDVLRPVLGLDADGGIPALALGAQGGLSEVA